MSKTGDTLYALRGGSGDRLLVLLHGMGANAEVWQPMLRTIEHHWQGPWIAPDLRGHGRSMKDGPFTVAQHATDVAALIADEGAEACILVGHSFGAAVAACVGAGTFGVMPERVVGFSVKVDWSDDDMARMRGLADRPTQTFVTRDEAAARALAFAGLKGLADVSSPVAQAGIAEDNGSYRLALAPGIFRAVDEEIGAIMRGCRAPLRLGSGEHDTMAPAVPMRAIDPHAVTFLGAGHNVQWEQPDTIWDFVLG